MTFRLATIAAALVFSSGIAGAQQPTGSVALGDLVQGLGVNTRVLVIGAHPDDEDTYLISWLARGKNVETAYLSLTRGEGGQNLIGNELGHALGQIRTEELLAARRVDGGRQFFTRAIDFGYSKTLAETETRWPRDLILKDVVAIIRTFRPHVIVSIWTGTAADGHGHHQYAGVIAKDAFEAAADSTRFSETMALAPVGISPAWAPLKLYRLARVPGAFSVTPNAAASPGNVKINVGEYDPLFGLSYAEIAARSRSQHASQGMGTLAPLGTLWDGFTLDTSRVGLTRATDSSLFAGIDTTWARMPASPQAMAHVDSMRVAIRDARRDFDAVKPAKVVPALSRVLRHAREARRLANCVLVDGTRLRCSAEHGDFTQSLTTTLARASRAVVLAAGVSVDALSAREKVAEGDSVDVTVSVYNRGDAELPLTGGHVVVEGQQTRLGDGAVTTVAPDSTARLRARVVMPAVSYPWWLRYGADSSGAIYNFEGNGGGRRRSLPRELVLGEDQLRSSSATVGLTFDGIQVNADVPVEYRFADPTRGERRHPLVGVVRVSPVLESSVDYIRAGRPIDHEIRLNLTSHASKPDTVMVELPLPPGLAADSRTRQVVLPAFGRASVTFRVQGTVQQGVYPIHVGVSDQNRAYREGFIEIQYPHIQPIRFPQPPRVDLSAVNVDAPARLAVAYLPGVGDNVPRMLEQLDLTVSPIAAEAIATLDPSRVSTLVIGPRALEVLDAPGVTAAAIQDFARRGGTVVMQYTQIANRAGILPFPVTLSSPADRVADETAPITILAPAHRLLRAPNVIGDADFANWVQERGLYMPRTFDPRWTTLIETIDPGERANRGALLVATVGKGTFVYTTLSFFRQLPAGNPGAARLFVNLLSAGLTSARVP